jgi:hypothetical protein
LTPKFVEQVKTGGMPEAKAKAIAQAFRDAQREVDLATKKISITDAATSGHQFAGEYGRVLERVCPQCSPESGAIGFSDGLS